MPKDKVIVVIPMTRVFIECVQKAHRTLCVACQHYRGRDACMPKVGDVRIVVLLGSGKQQRKYVWCSTHGLQVLAYYAGRFSFVANKLGEEIMLAHSPSSFSSVYAFDPHPFAVAITTYNKVRKAAAEQRKADRATAAHAGAEALRQRAVRRVLGVRKAGVT